MTVSFAQWKKQAKKAKQRSPKGRVRLARSAS